MHRPNPRRIIPIVILLLAIAGGYYLYSTGRLPIGAASAALIANTASGFIEGDEVNVASEIGGRIVTLNASEGDRVTAGQTLVTLDRALLDAQIAQGQATLDMAKAQLAQVKAGARAEDVRQAETALAQTVVVRDGAQRAWENAQAVRDNPQEMDARIAAAQTQVDTLTQQLEAAKHQLEVAQSNAKAAAVRKDQFSGPAKTSPDARVATEQWAAAEQAALTAQATLQAAQAALDGAQKSLHVLNDIRNRPLAANAQVDAAKLQYDSAAAAVDIAQARLDAVKAGATQEQIAVAEAAVKQAEAALNVLQVQATKTVVKSPATGVVARRALHMGEVVGPGTAVLTIVSLDPVKLTIYVPETQIGQIKIGDEIAVQVDSFPNKTFKGKVTFISPQAEFTPRNVQTKSERVNMVFAVKVQIPNEALELKPGMPADAVLK
ncbi:MAG: efflux RND transporter periplasmic adaptor subunit [Chloroflexota bacterium]